MYKRQAFQKSTQKNIVSVHILSCSPTVKGISLFNKTAGRIYYIQVIKKIFFVLIIVIFDKIVYNPQKHMIDLQGKYPNKCIFYVSHYAPLKLECHSPYYIL